MHKYIRAGLGASQGKVERYSRKPCIAPGFTIVELLVVIVVIGILAAITIVSYTGISQRALVASMQSDLSSASNKIRLFYVENSDTYPTNISDCPTPASSNLCLKPSSSSTYYSYSANNLTSPATFSLTAANGGNIYRVTNDAAAAAVASAPLSPAADWLATMQGDHYGNYYDLVSRQYATVSRAGGKTIYDPATQTIYNVPANYLGVNPRSDGKSGSEAVIEESRTNYLVNSYGAANDGSKWTTGWILNGNQIGTITPSLVAAAYGSTAQRVQYTGVSGDSSKILEFDPSSPTAIGSFAPGDSATGSFFAKGSLSGVSISAYLRAYDSSSTMLGQVSAAITPTSLWRRFDITYTNLPANTSRCQLIFQTNGIDNGDTLDVTYDAAQLEKGAFATSYIPTTTTTVTRNADVVTVPTMGWNAAAGTTLAAFSGTTATSQATNGNPRLVSWFNGDNNRIVLYTNNPVNVLAYSVAGGNSVGPASSAYSGTYAVGGMSWDNGGNLTSYRDGANKAFLSGFVTPSGLPATANLGSLNGAGGFFDGPISRLLTYSSALSDADVLAVTNAIKDGP